jgi:hypothetical protein
MVAVSHYSSLCHYSHKFELHPQRKKYATRLECQAEDLLDRLPCAHMINRPPRIQFTAASAAPLLLPFKLIVNIED